MASAAQSLRFTAKNCKCIRRPAFHTFPSIGESRTFSTTACRPVRRAHGESESLTAREASIRRALARVPNLPKQKSGFQNMNENKPGMGMVLPDDDFANDDISSLAHAQLDEHRERRNYIRIAAWEMPLLSEMAKPFMPPSLDTPLRFRYTSYLGESHPAERKVVLEFCPADMPNLTEKQRAKLVKLLGPRYNPEKEIAKMSSDIFENQAQNKRYLGDLVDSLLTEARDPTDTFEDVPIDTRHHVFKPKPRFPVEWRISKERQAALNRARLKVILLEEEKAQKGEVVDGVMAIEAALASKPAEPAPQLLMAGGRPKKGVAVRGRIR